MKKLFLTFLLFCFVGTASAYETIDGIEYLLNEKLLTAEVRPKDTIKSEPYTGNIVIPDSVQYDAKTYSVIYISIAAFRDCTKLTSVSIPKSVTSIGEQAFAGCSGLTSINVDSENPNYSEIDGVLCNKDKTILLLYPGGKQGEYIIPNSVSTIGAMAFYSCKNLTSVTIPNNVTSIGNNAFTNCTGLTSIEIPNSVDSIGNCAFWDCANLTSVVIPNSVTSIGKSAFHGCSGLTSIEIPNSVTSIAQCLFAECTNLTSVTIPNSVTSIEFGAFLRCSSLPSVEIPHSVTSIGQDAFYGCSSFTSIEISDNVTSIGKEAFLKCDSLTSVIINSNAIVSKNYSTINTSDQLLKNVFGNQVTSLVIGDGISSIGNYAFYWFEKLTSVTIPNSVTSIGVGAFEACRGLTSIEIPDSVTLLGDFSFAYCKSLTSVEIPNSVTSIGKCAFSPCSGLTSLTIGNNVTSIGKKAFYDCKKLATITCETIIPPSTDSSFNDFSSTLYVHKQSLPAYQAADEWSLFNIKSIEPLDTFAITFVNWDDSVLLELPVEEGVIPEYTGTTPIRPTDEDYTYTFSGWSPDIVAANQDTTYIAQYMAIPIGQDTIATEETEEDVDVNATPTEEGSVILEWPAVENADTYTITIAKNGEIICTLVFDDEGRLISIAFGAPARGDNGRNVPAAEKAAKGWRYEVKGLEPDTEYAYTVMAKQNETVLYSETIDFTMPAPQGIDDINAATKSKKIARDNQVLILRGDKTYTLTGVEVK